MKYSFLPFVMVFSLSMFYSCAQTTEKKEPLVLNEASDPMSFVSYSLGVSIAKNLRKEKIDSVNIDALTKGFEDFYIRGIPHNKAPPNSKSG